MALKVARFAALLFTALALTMTSAHVLELPQKMQWDPGLYATVNVTLYRYFAIVGGAYTVLALVTAGVAAWLARERHPAVEWGTIGAMLLALAFLAWLVVVQPVNGRIRDVVRYEPSNLSLAWAVYRDRWELGHVVGFVLQLLGLCALIASAVVETPEEAPAGARVRTRVVGLVRARPAVVAALYADWTSWPRLFPATIRGVRLTRDEGATKVIDVDHVEGHVPNRMTVRSPTEIELEEWKKRYVARFSNVFEPAPEGARCVVTADVTLTGPLSVLAPIAAPFVRARIRRFVLEPLRRAAEAAEKKESAGQLAREAPAI